MDFSEKWGTSVDEAVKLALADLKLTIDDVNVTVLEEPSKGFFGIGSKLAKVRVERKKPQVPEKEEKEVKRVKKEKKEASKATEKSQPKEKKEPKAEEKSETSAGEKPVKADSHREKRNSRKREKRIEIKEDLNLQERPADLVEVTEHEGLTFMKEIIEKMGLALEVKAYVNEDCFYVDIIGDDSGTLIGKRGQTLDAIQYLTSLVVNKKREKYMRVVIDAENYRSKREKTLEQLAERLASKVIKTGRSVRLEPMNPYERKIIHATLQKNHKVTTRSEGEEPYRRVIIELVR